MKRLSLYALATLSMLLAVSLVTASAQAPAAAPAAGAAKSSTKSAPAGTAKSAAKSTPAPASPGKPAAAPVAAGANAAGATKAAAASAATMIDLNSATKAELMKLPGIGEALSAKIIAGRPWANKAQLLSKNVLNKPTYDKVASMVIARQAK